MYGDDATIVERVGSTAARPHHALDHFRIANATHDQLKEAAARDGMVTLQDQALRLVEKDVTTLAEVARTVYVL